MLLASLISVYGKTASDCTYDSTAKTTGQNSSKFYPPQLVDSLI
jgi:hypothetical protein